ncbi:uncharacterized protein LOC113501729 isoform X3 [Trichoplusia ni]|uniref:Uncharacterized protein LOC113501729 isoform X3 n=1 Tax=Trichoplusia ni TaxID=7111 RepID=A0A7E5WDJ4_TRINI|nr:uncharacterized protein LOC113501729 isoform X3 [Trichoplusia ni]
MDPLKIVLQPIIIIAWFFFGPHNNDYSHRYIVSQTTGTGSESSKSSTNATSPDCPGLTHAILDMAETAGIIIFILWYLGIAFNYYMEWLPVKPREPPVEIQPVDTKPSKLSKWSKFTKFCKGSRGSKVICECPSIDDPIPEPNETIYEKIMNLVNYINGWLPLPEPEDEPEVADPPEKPAPPPELR